ncbi:Glycosyltransferase involved in cell wall bisynthesis [Ruminococcus sp. YE71]|uniref:bifunctional glycosyltransferase family 2/GtrA family protein n=1 Tax=unclassified Ruminococcus TaxID=2608920 RepID=UPI000883FED7|nr:MULTISPECIES: bifunctional glycosyltransferase family 2/GtrA family protein [unclassified Ruminococcus]SDA13447.1 Glycosyltransferase involved in cell wall bisynthesis [Ruminococcus sp. YE78]SFW19085.1 Glycosyltransferase involved in cell wall bisynthesis [Ruminococcus sp. YE71]
MTFRKIALIPAYKPCKELIGTVRELHSCGFEIVVVNDGSGEEFSPVFRTVEDFASVVVHDVNRGKGEALKTGMAHIRSNFEPPYIVVTADADGQHKTEDIIRTCEKAAQCPDSLVLGSRRFDKDVPLRSRFGNSVTRTVYRLTSGVKIYDTQTGLRAFSDRLIGEMLSVTGSRYEYEMNVLMEMPRRSIPIREVTIQTVYLDGNSSSHFNTVKDSFRIYREIFRYSASSFISFVADYGLFCLLSVLTGSAVVSNIAARVCSSVLNFNLNRKFVFRSEGRVGTSAVKYFTLAAVILALNTLILKTLSAVGVNTYAAKLVTETVLFLFSYIIQHTFVFRKERASA